MTFNRVLVGNMLGDSAPEFVAFNGAPPAALHAYDMSGTQLAGWPIPMDPVGGPPFIEADSDDWALGDIDGDGYDELVVATTDFYLQVFAYNGDGTSVAGWPVTLTVPASYTGTSLDIAGLTVADLDFDGTTEVIVSYKGFISGVGVTAAPVWIMNGDGSARAPWPLVVSGRGPVVVADLDGDHVPELISVHNSAVRALRPDGTVKFDTVQVGGTYQFPAVGDLQGDGSREVIVPTRDFVRSLEYGTQGIPPHFLVGATSTSGNLFYHGCSVGDVDGDGDLEIAAWSRASNNGASPFVIELLHHDMTPVAGWPKTHTPAIGTGRAGRSQMADLDGDGDAEIIYAYNGTIYVWDQPSVGTSSRGAVWGEVGHNSKGNYNFHEYTAPLPNYVRGDGNGDGHVDVSDVVFVLRYLYLSEPANCVAALDTDGDDQVSPLDAFALLDTLFAGLFVPEAPYPTCEEMPTEALTCLRFECP